MATFDLTQLHGGVAATQRRHTVTVAATPHTDAPIRGISMNYFSGIAVIVFALFLASSPASAERVNTYRFSIDLPEGWKKGQEERLITFTGPVEGESIDIILDYYENGDLQSIAAESIQEGNVRKLSGNLGYLHLVSSESPLHGWAALSKKGRYIAIATSKPTAALPEILRSMKVSDGYEDEDGLSDLLAMAVNPEVLSWLTHAQSVEDWKKSVSLREYKGCGITATVPTDWTVREKGNVVTFLSASGRVGLRASVFPVKSKTYEEFVKISKKIIKDAGGKNIRFIEGFVEYKDKDGNTGSFDLHGTKGLHIVFLGDSTEQLEVRRTISPQ